MLRASLHDKKPLFIGFYRSLASTHAPYLQLPMPLAPHIKAGE
jgi:hypothetical protein